MPPTSASVTLPGEGARGEALGRGPRFRQRTRSYWISLYATSCQQRTRWPVGGVLGARCDVVWVVKGVVTGHLWVIRPLVGLFDWLAGTTRIPLLGRTSPLSHLQQLERATAACSLDGLPEVLALDI